MLRVLIALAWVMIALPVLAAEPAKVVLPEVNWEEANVQRMFVVANDRQHTVAIVVATTEPEDLQAALRLQELVYRISAARLPIVDRQFVGDRWQKIHIAWDHYPMTIRKHPFVIEMQQSDPGARNPLKQIVISGASNGGIESAVSAFTEAAFGVPLKALEDKQYAWPKRGTLAIPESFGRIAPEFPQVK